VLNQRKFVFFKKIDFDPVPEMDQDADPDPELPGKSDPDLEIIFSDPTHCAQMQEHFPMICNIFS